MTSSKVARDSMSQRSPMGTATTGAMTGWKTVAPPVVVLRYCTPPEMMGVSVWEQRIMALDNSSSRRDKNLTNIVSSIAKKFMRAGAPSSRPCRLTLMANRQSEQTQCDASDTTEGPCHMNVN